MRVLHFSTGKHWRGGEQQILYTLQYLSSDIHSFLICQPGTEISKKAIPFTKQVLTLRVRNSLDLTAIFKLTRQIKSIKPDIIHFHDSKSHTLGILAVSFFHLKVTCVLSRRVLFHMKTNSVNRWKYNHPLLKKIITVSDAIKEKVKQIPVDGDKISTIYSGTNISTVTAKQKKEARNLLISRFKLDDDGFIIGNVSALTAEKDLETFIKAARKVLKIKPSAVFLSFGKGPLNKKLSDFIESLGISGQVKLTGFHEDIHDLLPGLDLLVSTSKSEGLGTNLLDGLKSQVPVIATNVGGIPEIIQHEENGLLFDAGNDDLLSQLIVKVANQPKLAKDFVDSGLATLSKFDAHRNVARIERVYKEVVSQ